MKVAMLCSLIFFSFEAKDFAFYITSLSTLKINQILKAYTRTDFMK